ncbi:hypothetical protein OSB04_020492 [Centaurea solstitialis]|uniref:25S rRNA (uridine-N(3))-methyltransferase BMT5-like domain-containing protein n=1 Tax=Centaurea solstitialis TaxID=347529 RepID=A0AA38SSC3_9ASTR|nr:hypothetical protein OSB04_020492 [Centaurea solstitialis]
MNIREALAIGSDTQPPVLHIHEEESDEEMNDIKKALALITRSMSKRNARKPMFFNNHPRRVKQGGRADYQKPEKKAKSEDKGNEVKKYIASHTYISMAKLLKIGMLKSIKHYSALHRMLLVGEGDMSFGASLARVFGDGGNLTVTSLESLGFFFFFS